MEAKTNQGSTLLEAKMLKSVVFSPPLRQKLVKLQVRILKISLHEA